ncbi:hypothetical protein SAMN05444161_3087 [Rhizobiales bacterium GAS191]|nr:hypothetical protein SAMN05519103_02284 [Rhizobiales bacterium GAS113]SEB85870.1 hypothetical protein SAMN05519104_0263 [Rhizobiales bacterium GAS188]SED38322.1 hypothetical protein SAMN05444161_3087 [Rhizobiales bacterium GAS191]
MKIVWDEPKRLANLETHGLDFADLGGFEWDQALIIAGHVSELGGQRFKAIGEFDGRVAVVVFARLGSEAYSVISFRAASRKERRLYEES